MMHTMMGLSAPAAQGTKPRLEVYGPLGLRAHIRTTLSVCYASLSSQYVVHELLWPGQPAYPHELPADAPATFAYTEGDAALPEHVRGQVRILPMMPPHANELPGRNIRMDPASCTWPEITSLARTGITVSAAPVTHRCPTLGYVFTEPRSASQSITPKDLAQLDSNTEALFAEQGIRNPRTLLPRLLQGREPLVLPDGTKLYPPPLDRPGRRWCILGDTSDASAGLGERDAHGDPIEPTQGMLALAKGVDLLVHECTYASMGADDLDCVSAVSNAHAHALQAALLGEEEAEVRAVSRGHATPRIAGAFAGHIDAHRVIFNHFSARIPAPAVESTAPLASESQLADQEGSLQKYHVLKEMERQVTKHWQTTAQRVHATVPGQGRNEQAIAAYDGLAFVLSPHAPE